MPSTLRVASPPAKAVMIYDGDCHFCSLWIHRWRVVSAGHLDFLSLQDPSAAQRFPEIPRSQLEQAVHLVECDGAVSHGAEAVFRGLALNPHERWLLEWYDHSPVFARVTEWSYAFIARHRTAFSWLTRVAWGSTVAPPDQVLIRAVFLRTLGAIYFAAFLSLWVQISGLIGSDGILPAAPAIDAMRQAADAQHLGWDRYHLAPTLCWWSASDPSLTLQCAAGVVLAVLLTVGFAPAPCLFLLWLIYLSLATVSRQFLSYQWDNLLLETGFLAIFLAPLQWGPRWAQAAPPSRLVLWLLRFLLFKLMFESGCVKLLSGDPNWRNFTALTFHYQTQPLPTWIGWYLHQLPAWIQVCSTVALFVIELVVPFFIFLPRRPRQAACVAFVLLHTVIFLTGNYGFFNLLSVALCLLLLDDAALRALWATIRRLRPAAPAAKAGAIPAFAPLAAPRRLRWPIQLTVPLAIVAIGCSLLQFSAMFRLPLPWPRQVLKLYAWLEPLRTFNSYGLFAVITTTRPEILIEGSNDGTHWIPYEFKYKPGSLQRRPGFVAPHQPRLDWQMWFAALSDYRNNPWILNFCVRLLRGSPPVLALLERNPFPKAPPRYVRAVLFDYRFTTFAERRQTGHWWVRHPRGLYLPPFSLSRDPDPPPGLKPPPRSQPPVSPRPAASRHP